MTPDRRRELVRGAATELVLDAAREIDFLGVGESLDGYLDELPDEITDGMGDLTDDERDQLCRDIHDAALKATVTVAIPDDALGGEA
jgi:hypothetical protein